MLNPTVRLQIKSILILSYLKFIVFLVLRSLSTFNMFFARHNSTRKHHKTFSCNLFGVHVLTLLFGVHMLTLLNG